MYVCFLPTSLEMTRNLSVISWAKGARVSPEDPKTAVINAVLSFLGLFNSYLNLEFEKYPKKQWNKYFPNSSIIKTVVHVIFWMLWSLMFCWDGGNIMFYWWIIITPHSPVIISDVLLASGHDCAIRGGSAKIYPLSLWLIRCALASMIKTMIHM